jgi:hypothetical protein
MLQHFFELMHGRLPIGYAVVRNIWISAVPLGATPAPANNSREMEERSIYRKFYVFFKLRRGCAIYRKLDCYAVRLFTVLVLWTHEHFTIVFMAYLWQNGVAVPLVPAGDA